ncbi:MAG: hypothetical protein JWN25_3188, partial [Verrucomicrobiales bacterium]|nr:hypothetical protein [Verrucomicrobiales bacterium]
MQSKSDAELLREFVLNGNEQAFAELVARYTSLVYSAASRQTESPSMAEEASQLVFLALARAAQSLSGRMTEKGNLAGWLCRSARNVSLNLRRNEIRQYNRERETMEHVGSDAETARDWELLRPVLDSAMAELGDKEFDLLVMRYFDGKDLRSVGVAFGVSNDTA